MAIKVIASLYDAVSDNAPYESMFFAMDEVIESVLGQPHIEESAENLNPLFMPHFERAAHIFDVLSQKKTVTPLTYVQQRSVASAVVDSSGHILAANDMFREEFSDMPKSLHDLFSSSGDKGRFQKLTKANAEDSQALLNIDLPDKSTSISLLAGFVPDIDHPTDRLIYVVAIQPRWNDGVGDLLAETFKLNTAEIDILKAFVTTGSVQAVADQRGRSIRTVRTQLSRIFGQMNISGQTGLALFLATLSGLQSEVAGQDTENGTRAGRKTEIKRHVLNPMGHQTEILEYGRPDGDPVFLIQSTHPADLTVDLRRQLYEAGLRVIAPLKPGSGESAKISGQSGPEQMAPIYFDIIQSMGIEKPILAGQASGGLYALHLANSFPNVAKAVCLIDTGVPFKNRLEIMRLHKNIRRTMIPARFFPELLFLPHKLVAANFKRSAEGEASVIDYFFIGSPIERELTQTKKQAYDATKSIISYSFDDPDRLVKDVSRWASDWSSVLQDVATNHRLRFVHDTDNQMFKIDPVRTFAGAAGPNCDIKETAGAGQLAAFEYSKNLVQAIKGLGKD